MKKATKTRQPPSATRTGRLELLMEHLDSKVTLLAETMGGRFDALERSIDDLRRDLTARVEVLEAVVRQNSQDLAELRAETAELRAETAELRAEMTLVRAELRTLATKAELTQLEIRVARLEERLLP